MRDFGDKFRRELIEATVGFFSQEPDVWPERDYFYDAKLSDAIQKLGRMWRGRVDCEHKYTNADGMETKP